MQIELVHKTQPPSVHLIISHESYTKVKWTLPLIVHPVTRYLKPMFDLRVLFSCSLVKTDTLQA